MKFLTSTLIVSLFLFASCSSSSVIEQQIDQPDRASSPELALQEELNYTMEYFLDGVNFRDPDVIDRVVYPNSPYAAQIRTWTLDRNRNALNKVQYQFISLDIDDIDGKMATTRANFSSRHSARPDTYQVNTVNVYFKRKDGEWYIYRIVDQNI